MRLLLDILQGAGLAGAAGIRPFLPALLTGALASAHVGVDFRHTDYAFLGSFGFLLAIVVALALTILLERRLGSGSVEDGPLGASLAGIGIGLGALLFAASLAQHGYASWPGLIGGLLCAALAQVAVRSLFRRTRARLDPDARAALPVYADGSSLLLAGLSVLAPPISLLALGLFGWLLAGARRRGDSKHAGLRTLK
ncbi:MAG TPA: DUF4126 family protein [Solirubrobacteraceae bacterium]|nr:DUF4126 family protein [Solirubrobacteraceae bacterium]